MTLGERMKIIVDLSLAAMSVFGLLIAIFVGIGLVHKEIQRRTVYTLLAKPISRRSFVIGKYAGLMLVIALNVAVMTGALLALTAVFSGSGVAWHLLVAVLLILVELMIVTAVAVLFSTFSTPTLSAMLTLGVWLIGRFSSDLVVFARKSDSVLTRGLVTACTTCCRTSRSSTSSTSSSTTCRSSRRTSAPRCSTACSTSPF